MKIAFIQISFAVCAENANKMLVRFCLRQKLVKQVLEIGGGSGSNFSFVETSVEWTVTEPNLHFESYFIENSKEWNEHHDIGKLVQVPV
jgi:hypothetical protein